jgi:hypothetical protein
MMSMIARFAIPRRIKEKYLKERKIRKQKEIKNKAE